MKQSRLDNISRIAFIAAIAFIAFIAGGVASVAKVYPYSHFRDAYRGGTALYQKLTSYTDPYSTDLWAPERTDAQGVTVHEAQRAHAGWTLYTSGDAPRATLIDMDGRVAHVWERRFSDIWDETAAVRRPVPDAQTYFRKARVLPNGDLVAIIIGVGDTPYGYGMVRLDRDSKLLWKNLDHFHHDFDIDDSGRIYGLTHDFRRHPIEEADQFEPPVLDDYLTILSPDGRTQKRISLLDALNRSPFRRLLWRIHYYSMEDPLHTNGVDYLDADAARSLARTIPAAREGQVLLSFRELAGGSIALLDPEKEEIVWASHGPWLAQHDPDILPNGNILIFDNRGHFGAGGRSRVLEVNPATGGIVWSYTGSEEKILDSAIRSAQEPLPNGNVLITESNGGRLLEVTRDGSIVWEFINPVRKQRTDEKFERIPVLSWAQRIDPASLTPEFRADYLTIGIKTTEETRNEH
ncbi:arylsulfotransferase family protein [Thiohalobacter thiocyanaticus]|uniref:Uncharacterized protein n=1 Tax=Thiohalobacter thiocyanaticus TaxID=585455 RepID=A0A426QIX4_9GAMM|nr:arylsulfotransferase family protein [Thiohalobacter thiocyanaticus]RRQ21695.1 hypothetical protein D6C00_06860 [Thiohalobacter thiocyanaticus]